MRTVTACLLKSAPVYMPVWLIFILIFSFNPASGQYKWNLTEDHDGIRIYTRPMANSKIKAIKAECILPATSSQLVAAILDIKNCGEWVYHSKKNVLIKQVSPLDLIYYAEVDVPWPAENRDYVVHIKVDQHPQTKVVTVNSPCIPGYVEEQHGIVRIRESVARWTITPVGKDQIRAEYILEVDPQGTIPAWLINLFATKGPYETFRKLRLHLQQNSYKNAHFAMIRD
jgi:hypothetical protein